MMFERFFSRINVCGSRVRRCRRRPKDANVREIMEAI